MEQKSIQERTATIVQQLQVQISYKEKELKELRDDRNKENDIFLA